MKTCKTCAKKEKCENVCADVDRLLPADAEARVDVSDIYQLADGREWSRYILSWSERYTLLQQYVIDQYFIENKTQSEIAGMLEISQPAIAQIIDRL